MTLEQGGHGPGERVYERKLVDHAWSEPLPAPASMPPGLPVGRVIAVPDPRFPPRAEHLDRADLVLDSLTEFSAATLAGLR